MNPILSWELGGIVLIVLGGVCLHFTFDWLGGWRSAALIAAVNESTWEHFKIAFWPGLFFSLMEYRFLRVEAKNFWLARSVGLSVVPVTIIILFYGYTAITERHYLPVDILIFCLAIAVGQMASYKLLLAPDRGRFANRCGVIWLALMVLAFSLLTYYPPRIFLFQNLQTQGYGIP